jgi:8-oxo-dGTP diphosphatase
MIESKENRYGGVIISSETIPQKVEEFKKEIIQLIENLKDKKLIWIKIPMSKSSLIPILTNLNFKFHHCDDKGLILVKKVAVDAVIPTGKNYIVGVGALVFYENQLLVIKEKHSKEYKLPGGHIDKGETIKEALKREVYEETGIHIEFESIMNIGHFIDGQFGESNLYIVCTAKAKSNNINIIDSEEICEAKWISQDDFINSDSVNNYNKSIVIAAINNKELKLTEQQVKLRVSGEVFY